MDNPKAHFPDRHHRTLDGRSERKQHFAALGQWSDQNAGDLGPLLGSVGADRLLKTYLQSGPDSDRLGQGMESCKCQRGEAALEKWFYCAQNSSNTHPCGERPMVMNKYSPHEALVKTQV